MTKISKKTAYPIKTPIAPDYFVGTDSENNGKTVNFSFESASKLINEINGTPIVNYLFRTDVNIPLTVLTDGVFLSAENETSISSISKLYINKKNFSEVNLTELFQFISVNLEVFLLKLRNSSNLNNAVYFKITGAVEYESYITLDVTIHLNNSAVTELVNFNVYFFDFELSSSDLVVSLPEFNKIVSQTGFTSTETQIIFNPTWVWLLKNVSYTNASSVTKTINPTATGKKRIDVFVLNTSNTFQTISGAETTGSPVKPTIPIDTLEVTFCIVGDTGIENVEQITTSVVTVYKTYFVNSIFGNNDTGIYQDSTRPYATIDYILGLSALKSGDIIFLQNGDGVFPFNGQIPTNFNLIIKADQKVTVDFSSNANANIIANSSGYKILTFDMPLGIIKNERNNGIGVSLRENNDRLSLYLNIAEIYWNCSSTIGGVVINSVLKINKFSMSGNKPTYSILNSSGIVEIVWFVILSGRNSPALAKEVTIHYISGAGGFMAQGDVKYRIGDIATTLSCMLEVGNGSIDFMASVINVNVEIGGYLGDLFITGTIKSCPLFTNNGIWSNNTKTLKFLNFVVNFGLGSIQNYESNLVFENCSIISTNSPIKLFSGVGTLKIKNSAFEVINAVPLVTGGAASGKTIKISGVSSNATMLSDQNGTGVTITQFTNY
jgi:hypothetical protein